jgi:Glycosyltransferase family 87
VLLTVPYAAADFPTALLWLRWTQLAAIALVWALCYELFRPPVPGWAWALAGGAFGLWAPVWQGLAWGQPIGLLALGTLGVWWLARSERPFAFGLVLAAATLVRPFLALHVVLACGWPVRQQAKAAAGLLVGGLVPFALLGVWPWDWYRLASDAGAYVSGCGSIPGVLNLGAAGGQALFALAAAVLAWLRWRGLGVDETAALAAVAAMLAYPLAWFQYDASLIPVVAWVVAGVATAGNRAALWMLVAYLLLRALPDMIPTPGGTGLVEALARNKGWLQVLGRAVLLGAVVSVIRGGRVSARGSS